jgi:hypothetical protein
VPVALISQALGRRRFAGENSAVGAHITLSGVDHTVVGIAPAGLPFLTTGDIWTPLTVDPGREIRLNHVITVFGRLRPGVAPRQAQLTPRGHQDWPNQRATRKTAPPACLPTRLASDIPYSWP